SAFAWNTKQVKFNKIGVTYTDGNNGGPTTAVFNASGTKLAVSTWGVAHFLTKDPDLSLQKPGRLYMYDFANGILTQTGLYEETGVSGNIGLSWSPNEKYVYMANFNLHSAELNNSVTVHDATTAVKVQNFGTSNTSDDEACWTHVSADNRTLYVASFTGDNVSIFNIGSDDKLSVSLNPNFIKRSGVPSPDTKDIYEGSGGYLYVSGAFQSHTISIFKMNGDGSLTERSGSPYHIPSSAGKTSDEQSFLGLTGFDKNAFDDDKQQQQE
ncbi:MAG: beta-propeller fold lactonase family protein, partial [Parafilimonas sp.]